MLQKSIGEDQIRKHLPAALGGAGPIPSAARPEAEDAEAAAADADAAPDGAPIKAEASPDGLAGEEAPAAVAPEDAQEDAPADEAAADGDAEVAPGDKRALDTTQGDAAATNSDRVTKSARTRKDSADGAKNGVH